MLAHFCLGRISLLHDTFVACRLSATSVGSCIFVSGGVVDASRDLLAIQYSWELSSGACACSIAGASGHTTLHF